MEKTNFKLIKALTEHCAFPAVSVYMTPAPPGEDSKSSQIVLKNLLRDVDQGLGALDARRKQEILRPLTAVAEGTTTFPRDKRGRAWFCGPGIFKYFTGPAPFESLAVVGHRFHLKPLVPFFAEEPTFYLLALSQADVQLFEGTRFSLTPVPLDADVPTTMESPYDPEQSLQYHSSKASGAQPIYHGHGGGKDDTKPKILQFFSQVSKGVRKQISSRAPLVLAGVEFLLPLYRQAAQDVCIVDREIVGHPSSRNLDALHKEALRCAKPVLFAERELALGRFKEQQSQNLGTTRIDEIVPAAVEGRVDTLFVSPGARCWGRYDPTRRSIRLDKAHTAENEDLYDLAAVQTHLNGGKVWVVPQEELGADVAALYRYA